MSLRMKLIPTRFSAACLMTAKSLRVSCSSTVTSRVASQTRCLTPTYRLWSGGSAAHRIVELQWPALKLPGHLLLNSAIWVSDAYGGDLLDVSRFACGKTNF